MKQKRSPKNKKKTTRKVARHSNPSGRKQREDPKGFATQSGGVNISGGKVDVGGDIIGRDKIIYEAPPEKFDYLHQLPSPPADFVGRDAELKILRGYVKHGGATICAARGLGGVGKTTLALKLAHDLKSDYPEAQFYLNLQGASEKPLSPSDALAHVIRAYHPTAKLPESEVELRSIYLSLLDGKRALVLMDNAKDAKQLEPLIPPATCLLLVTSRNKFALAGLKPLDLESLPPDDARNLLHKIAPRITQYEIRLTDDLISLCACLPLALRLAGSALAEHIDLEPAQYVKRLQDKKNRLQLIEASFSLSYDLLTKEQQKLWRMLAIFPSSFEVMGASAVWGIIGRDVAVQRLYNADLQDEALDKTQETLSDFVHYSILDYDPTTKCYNLHDLARIFANLRMSEQEKYDAGVRHATHYKDVVSFADQLYKKGFENAKRSLDLFDAELANIQAGQAWTSARVNENDKIAELCSDYAGQWNVLNLRLHPRIYIGWMQSALVAARKLKNKNAEGVHLGNLGGAYSALDETRKAIELYEQALVIAREIGDKRNESAWLGNLGLAYADLGQAHKAIEFYEQDAKISREIGDRRLVGNALMNTGNAHYSLGDIQKAIEYHEQVLPIFRAIGYKLGEGQVLGNLGAAYSELDETSKAIEFYEQALKIMQEIGDRRMVGTAFGNLGIAYAKLGEMHKAIEFYEQGLKITREIGNRRGEGNALWYIALAFDKLGERAKAIEYAEESLKIRDAIETPRAEKVRKQLEEWRGEKH